MPSSGSSGFSPPHCYQRFIGPESLVLSVNLPPSAPPRFGVASSIWFSAVAGNLRRQSRRASLGKTHHLPISRPASCRFGSPDIRSRLVTSTRPPPQHHIAGSLFATYTGSASCFLQTSISGHALALLASSFRPVTADPLSQLSPGTPACASCQAHVSAPPAKPGASEDCEPLEAAERGRFAPPCPPKRGEPVTSDSADRLCDPLSPGAECTPGSPLRPDPRSIRSTLGPRSAAPHSSVCVPSTPALCGSHSCP